MAADREPTHEAKGPPPEGDPALAPTMAEGAERPARRSLPPSLVARYEDITLVGEGGMGIVYRGHDPRLGRTVALKLIKGEDPDLWRRFIQEARAQARVQHEHVCRVYEAGQADGEPYIVMQFIAGEPLSRARASLSLEQGVKLMREVASAVHEAHRLGLIHRDLKPQNILVERPEDGVPKPYVMDFGLARDVAERGQTMTGAVVGTPAYMPPEQALGEVRAMDRRSDVYSLGATLYDVIAGRPPFVSEHPWKLLMNVAYDDPPSLGQVKRGVPSDLETIVMKCLEREPARRYDSARALADDLQRFLDGEPILAKRASLRYVVWKKARKHRLATALAATAIAAALSLGGVWAKGRRDAAEQARLAQALGEDVKGMELFLRNAYGMPLHDVERERDIVRKRLARIEANMAAAGRVGQGPGHYAMGRGYLALGDPAAARGQLEMARAAGYSSPALDYALGQALGELYRRAIEETKRITNEEERKKRVAVIEAELRDPALARLRAVVGAEIEAPAYAEGLIALYEGRNEEALAKAKAAFESTPWLYEAKKLEGDAHYAMGNPFRHDAAFDWDKMMAHFKPAAEAYRAAGELARSDPEVHRAECELWEKIGWAEDAHDEKSRIGFEAAEAACARAAQASHADVRARVQHALVLSSLVRMLAGSGSERAPAVADVAVHTAEDAVGRAPDDVMAHYARARAHYERNVLWMSLGREVMTDAVIAAYREVVALDPHFTWAVSELGDAYLLAAEIERPRGRDVRSALASAARQFEQASALDPSFVLATQKKVKASATLLEIEIEHGRSTDAMVEGLLVEMDALERRMGAGVWTLAFLRAGIYRLRGLHEMGLGRDPRPYLRAGLEALGPLLGAHDDPWLLEEVAEIRLVEASHELNQGLMPRAPLEEARRVIADVARVMGTTSADWRILAARAEILAIRAAMQARKASAASFEAALAALSPVLSQSPVPAAPLQLAAEIHARRAAWLQQSGKDSRADIVAGRARADEALSRNPHLAAAFATKGLLAFVEARAAIEEGARDGAKKQAKEAFEMAFREQPGLARDYEEARQVGVASP
ncbi:MAG: protein kinase [Minicystis sp.]